MKHKLLTALCFFATAHLFAQTGKELLPSNIQADQKLNLNIQPFFKKKAFSAENPFGVSAIDYQAQAVSPLVTVTMGDEGLPIYFEGTTNVTEQVSDKRSAETVAMAYLSSLQPAGIKNPATEFSVKRVQVDARDGSYYVLLAQQYMGVPVVGAELKAHTNREGVFTSAAGRYAPTPNINDVAPQITVEAAINTVVGDIGAEKVKRSWSETDLELIGGQQFVSNLVIYRVAAQNNVPHLAWHIEVHPSLVSKRDYFIDAKTGAVLHRFESSCNLMAHVAGHQHKFEESIPGADALFATQDGLEFAPPPPPAITATGVDLAGDNQSFGAWKHSDNKRYLIDTSKPMFNASGSAIPNGNMKGVIVTRDQKSVLDGPVSHITSTSDNFNNPNAVSAHVNSGVCYEYYKNTFDRNSIDGNGGTINVVVNVVDADGAMDNAYWNGNAMYWGNGKDYFTPLAKSLDVAGHEMSHGVVQETADLVYEGESGALNESFADIFGVMIDRDDWGIGEGIFLPGQSATGYLRDFVDPHNGDVSGGNGNWQPSHYSERYTGTDDNGGVHANSGITNHAFYLFATDPAVGKDIAEQVYYYALRDRLTASSKFVDLRLAIIAEATAFYDMDVVNAAIAAFNAVGISSGTGSTLAGTLTPGQGTDYILSVSNDEESLNLSSSEGILIETLYDEGVSNKPSVTDNGEQIVFVNDAHQIVGIEIAYNTPTDIQLNVGIVSEDTTWRNVAISKDGRFLAGLTTLRDNKIIIFDLADPLGPTPREYFLVNPTFTQQTPWVDNVQYADVLEFDYTGNYLAYDAYSFVENAEGEDVSQWDIGLLKYWENGQFTPVETPNIRKLVTGLPEQVGVADPAFAKNSPYAIAFDYYEDQDNGSTVYSTRVANFETGKNGPVVSNSLELGYPCFTTHDDKVLFNQKSLIGGLNLRTQKLKANMVEPLGNPANIILGQKWGVWLNNGTRVLSYSATNDIQQANLAFTLSPNPVNDLAQISQTLPEAATVQYQVLNMFGQVMIQKQASLTAGENQFNVDVHSLAAGTYFVRIATGKMQGVKKIVKQ